MKIIILLLSLLVIALSQTPQPNIEPVELTPQIPEPDLEAPEPTPESPETENTTIAVPSPEETSPEVATPEETTPEVATPEETTPEVATPEETTPEVPSGVYKPPYYVELQGVNPIGMCQITKSERWVTFFFYSSETDVTIPIKNPTNWASQISADDKEWKNSLSDNSTGYPGQPTSLKKGFHPAFALSTPFFTAPKGISGGKFKLQQVKYQLDTAFVLMNVDAPEYNCPSTASFLVNYINDNSEQATLNKLEASSDILFKSVNISDTKSRLTITRSANGTNTTYRFVISKNGYKRPLNQTDIWNTYNNGWPAEVESAQDWELLFLLISKQYFIADGVSGAEFQGLEIEGFKNQAFKLPSNAILPDGSPASNPDGTPYDPNWVDPNDNTPTTMGSNSGNYLITVMTMYLFTLSLLFI